MSSPEHELGCPRQLDAASYVLGADEQPESYRAHLAHCAACQAEVADLQSAVDALPASVPATTASGALRSRVLATVRSEAEILRAAGANADRAPSSGRRVRWRRWSILATCAVAGTAAVAIALALSGGSSQGARVTKGQIAASIPGASAALDQSGGHADLVVSGMIQPPLGKIYEVWLSRRAGEVQPTDSLFGVTSKGDASAAVPSNLRGVRELLVTSEPLGGSAQPTSSPVIRVSLRS